MKYTREAGKGGEHSANLILASLSFHFGQFLILFLCLKATVFTMVARLILVKARFRGRLESIQRKSIYHEIQLVIKLNDENHIIDD